MVRSILFTGGNGYIGSHTCIEFLAAGYRVISFDNLVNSSKAAYLATKKIAGVSDDMFRLVEGDMLNIEDLENVFTEYGPFDGVIHFGGLKAVNESVRLPLLYYNNNITGTLNLLEIMKKHNCKKIVFSSSATVYGNSPSPVTEESPVGLGITNAYGWTKFFIEQILRDVARADKDWSVVILRYFNPVGAHPSGDIGESPNGIPNNLMPYIQQVVVGRLKELHVFGNDYAESPDGTGIRDYIHVCDLARGHLAAVQYVFCEEYNNDNSQKNHPPRSPIANEEMDYRRGVEVFNLGTGNGQSVMQMMKAMEKCSGKPIPYVIDPRRSGDLAVVYSSAEKAKQVLHWQANLGVNEMCGDAYRWQIQHPNGFSD